MLDSGLGPAPRSMVLALAEGAVSLAGGMWLWVAPFVGIMGAFIAGSATVSNLMLGNVQLGAALATGLAPQSVLALQSVGSAIGNMICIHNVVAACATVGLVGREGDVIRQNLPIAVAYGLVVAAVGALFLS
jgi:lactate permease